MNNEELQEKFEQLASTLDWIKTKLVDLQEEKGLASVKKPYEVEFPKNLEDLYYVDVDGEVDLVGIHYRKTQKVIYKRGVTFKTVEEAEKYDKERILLFKLRKWAEEHNGGWTPDWKGSDDKFSIYYFHNTGSFSVCSDWNYNSFSELPYFKSEELAREFIEEFGDEIKEVLL